MLGNLLENAVEACQKLPDRVQVVRERKIELVIKPLGGLSTNPHFATKFPAQGEVSRVQLALMVCNTFDGTVIKDGDQLASTKKEGGGHGGHGYRQGLGLQSVKAVVERYGDFFYFDYDDQWFRACVCWGKGSKEQ